MASCRSRPARSSRFIISKLTLSAGYRPPSSWLTRTRAASIARPASIEATMRSIISGKPRRQASVRLLAFIRINHCGAKSPRPTRIMAQITAPDSPILACKRPQKIKRMICGANKQMTRAAKNVLTICGSKYPACARVNLIRDISLTSGKVR